MIKKKKRVMKKITSINKSKGIVGSFYKLSLKFITSMESITEFPRIKK